MKQVVIKTGGKQYLVKEGQIISVEKLPVEAGGAVVFDQVLAVIDGANTVVGQPLVKGGVVEAQVLAQTKDKKVRIEKFANKTRYHRVAGHQQCKTQLKITSIKP